MNDRNVSGNKSQKCHRNGREELGVLYYGTVALHLNPYSVI